MKAAGCPFSRMLYHTCPDHVEIDINEVPWAGVQSENDFGKRTRIFERIFIPPCLICINKIGG
jgi:hypothetical protein